MVPIALVQTMIPLAAILWLWLGRPTGTLDILLRAAAAMALTLAAAQAGLWLALPRATVLVFGALLLLALFGAFRRAARASDGGHAGFAGWAGRGLTLIGAAAGATVTGIALAGAEADGPVIDLAFPFEEGRYLVAEGGSSALINANARRQVLALSGGRGQGDQRGMARGIALVRIDALGFQTREPSLFFQPIDPAAYLLHGTPVVAPCSGIVARVVDTRSNLSDLLHGGGPVSGNHVAVQCGSNRVVVGPFLRDSVPVTAGQFVAKGMPIGVAGHRGGGDEPHLHIHAQRMPEPGAHPLSGEPVTIRFEGRVPVRNMSFAIE